MTPLGNPQNLHLYGKSGVTFGRFMLITLPYALASLIILLVCAVIVADRKTLLKVDYSLLITFVAFFIFVGNMGRIEIFSVRLGNIIGGRETITAILASQVIGNVPAALLLSGFTENINALIIGTNLGGLGTLIASMASLISYRQIVNRVPDEKEKYFKIFTISNIVMLIILIGVNLVINRL